MSTPRWKAKEVRKIYLYKGRDYGYSILDYFQIEDGRKFYWARHDEWNKNTQFYLVKDLGLPRFEEFRYLIFPIPHSQALNYTYHKDGRIKWFEGSRAIVVEVK